MSMLLKPGKTIDSSSLEIGLFLEHDVSACCIINMQGGIVYCNGAFSTMLDRDKGEIHNQPITKFIVKDRANLFSKISQMSAGDIDQRKPLKVTIINNRGITIYADILLTLMETASSDEPYFLARFIDKSASTKALNLFGELYKMYNHTESNSRDEISQQFVTICNHAFEGSFSYCFYANKKNDSFQSYFWVKSEEEDEFCIIIPPDFSFSSAKVWTDSYFTRNNSILYKKDLKNIPNLSCLDKLQVNSMMTVTLYNDNEPVGVVGIASMNREYSTMDLKMLEHAAFIFSTQIAFIEGKKREESLKRKVQFAEMKLLKKSNELLVIEQRLKKTLKELEEAKQKAADNEVSRKGLLKSFSQELRTPMNAIIGFADLLKEEEVEEQQKDEFVNIINQSSKQIMQVVNNIMDLSKIESGSIEIIPREFSINTLIRELSMLYIPIVWSRKNGRIKLFYTLDFNDGKDFIIADEKRVRQIFNILLDNAAKYTVEGEIEINYKLLGNNFLLFGVRDTGMGISDECLENIFDNPSADCKEQHENDPGVSLGLNISKKLVNLMGGEIWVESTKEVGSTFFFTLPYKKAEPATLLKDLNKSTLSKLLTNRRILVVEDDPMSYKLLEKILTASGAEVVHAENGKVAVNFVKSSNDFDLVLMDIRMPVMDGIEATKLIKEYNSALPVIVQTAFTMYEEEMQARAAGCDDFISKPVRKDQLFVSILEHVK